MLLLIYSLTNEDSVHRQIYSLVDGLFPSLFFDSSYPFFHTCITLEIFDSLSPSLPPSCMVFMKPKKVFTVSFPTRCPKIFSQTIKISCREKARPASRLYSFHLPVICNSCIAQISGCRLLFINPKIPSHPFILPDQIYLNTIECPVYLGWAVHRQKEQYLTEKKNLPAEGDFSTPQSIDHGINLPQPWHLSAQGNTKSVLLQCRCTEVTDLDQVTDILELAQCLNLLLETSQVLLVATAIGL